MNLIDQLMESLQKGSKPNSLTLEMGEQIRRAREEAGINQRDLAKSIYRRQAALSEMENGYMEPDAETLLLLALQLKKTISYFFPRIYRKFIETGELSELEMDLLTQARRLSDDDLERIVIQVKALGNLTR
jgi:transcriptional regulator with XRE-family HTH domain